MSKGPGRIERAIRVLFDAHPDLAFVTDELAEHCYPDARPIERRHQVATLRAARRIIARDPDWTAWRIEGQGRGWVFLNHANVRSYALARLIGDQFNIYRSERRARRAVGYDDFPLINGARVRPDIGIEKVTKDGLPYARVWGDYDHVLVRDRGALTAMLASDRYRDNLAPDGAWARQVALHVAERDGDAEVAAALRAALDAEKAAWLDAFAKRFGAAAGDRNATLTALAERARGLAVENDPDAVRAGLAALAAALEAMADTTTPPPPDA